MALGGLGSIGHGFYQSYQDFRNGDTEAGWLLLLTSSFGSVGWARQYGSDAKNIFRDILNDNRGFVANPFSRTTWGPEHGRGNVRHNNALETELDIASNSGATDIEEIGD